MYGPIPKETLAEVLLFLSENEDFPSLKKFGTISQKQLSQAFQELAKQIKAEVRASVTEDEIAKLTQELKKPFQDIIKRLKPAERERLLKGFLN